jgi:hypothetical protein
MENKLRMLYAERAKLLKLCKPSMRADPLSTYALYRSDHVSSGVPKPSEMVSTVKDLRRNHLAALRGIRTFVERDLASLLGINSCVDGAFGLFFHYPVGAVYSVLHLHVCINFEERTHRKTRSRDLTEVIREIEVEGRVTKPLQYVLEENEDGSLDIIKAWISNQSISPRHAAWFGPKAQGLCNVSDAIPPRSLHCDEGVAIDKSDDTHEEGRVWVPSNITEQASHSEGGALFGDKYEVEKFVGRGSWSYGWIVRERRSPPSVQQRWFAKTFIDRETWLQIKERRLEKGEKPWLPQAGAVDCEIAFLCEQLPKISTHEYVLKIHRAEMMDVFVPRLNSSGRIFVQVMALGRGDLHE